ncbi:MAG: hypothetical protein JST87_11435 [Bacteroidetes bacterium]|nr:hypothetical protein [Bacteroidota bacterium]
MKLVIATCIKEYQEKVQKIFSEAKADVFSAVDITGFKGSNAINLLEEWFAAGDEKFDSNLIFSFTDEEKAGQILSSIKDHNTNNSNFPVRGFVIPVETHV